MADQTPRLSHQVLQDVAERLLRRDTVNWDRPNELWGLRRSPLGSLEAIGLLMPPGQEFGMPSRVLGQLAALARNSGIPVPPDMVGAALVVETWTLEGDAAAERQRRLRVGGSIPLAAEHPDRKEGRLCMVGDLGLNGLAVTLLRGSDETRCQPLREAPGSLTDSFTAYLRALGRHRACADGRERGNG